MKSLIRSAAIILSLTSSLIVSASHADTGSTPVGNQGTIPSVSPGEASGRIMLLDSSHFMGSAKLPDGSNFVIKSADSSDAALAASSPEQLAKRDAFSLQALKEQCGSKQNVFAAVAHEFPGEAGAFYSGLAMSAQLQMHSDPAALQHFYQHNVTSVMGHVSFAFFMLGSRATTSSLVRLGLAYDPCHEIKRGKTIKFDEKNGRPIGSKAQMRFANLMGPLTMTGGFLLSSMFNEFLSDPNIHLCAYGLIADLKPDDLQKSKVACSQSYKDWVSTRKIVNYMPDLLSMTITSLIQAYAVNLPLSATTGLAQKGLDKVAGKLASRALIAGDNRAVTALTIRTLSVAANFAPGGPLVRFGVQAAGALIFVTINDYVVHPIKWNFERWRQGRDITGEINDIYSELDRVEKAGWIWTPKPLPAECSFEPTVMDYQLGYQYPFYCSDKTEKISTLINELNEKSKKWRETVLAEAYTAHGNWKDYLNQFQTTYTDAHNFNTKILNAIAWKNDPSNPPDPQVTKLYDTAAVNGIDTSFFKDICNISDDQKKVFKTASDLAVQSLDQLKTGQLAKYDKSEVENLSIISEGLKAVDCTQVTAAILAVKANVQAANPNAGEQSAVLTELLNAARTKQVHQALDLIYQVLNGSGPLATYGKNRISPIIAPVNENPFFGINQLIGDSRPQTAGTAYLNDVDNDNTIIDQATKDQHPPMMGRVVTSNMSNYLLAAMVCGPSVGAESNGIETHPLAQHRQSSFGWVLDKMGIGFDLTNRMIDSKSMLYVEYENKDANSLISGLYGVRANFRPPMIVKLPGADANRNLCREANVSLLGAKNQVADPRDVEFTINGQKTKGLLDVVKRYADPSLFGADSSIFENFWAKTVDTHVLKVIDLFQQDFKHIVSADFLPNFTRTDVKEYNGRRFEIGTIKSLQAQVHMNLFFLGKSLFPTTTVKSPAAEIEMRRNYVKLSLEFQRQMNLQLQLLTGDEPAKAAMSEIEKYAFQNDPSSAPAASAKFRARMQADSDANQASMKDLLKTMQSMPNARAKVSIEAVKTLGDLQDASVSGIEALVTETSSYYGIIDTIHVDGLN